MGKFRYTYGDMIFQSHLDLATNCQKIIEFEKIHCIRMKESTEEWIERFEAMKEAIENVRVNSKTRTIFRRKCDNLTHEMGILINAQQMLYRFILTVHQNF